MQIKQLEYFVEVANSSSINQAAQKLYISQQALSASLTAFEKELGYPILLRSKQGVELTSRGKQILIEAEDILHTVQKWFLLSDSSQKYISGHVVVAAPTSICNAIMPSIILECKQLYPDITIHLYEARGEQLFDYISEENNFIIINGYTKEKEKFLTTDIRSRDLSFFPLFNDELCIFLNSNHPYAQYRHLKPAKLKEFTLTLYPEKDIFPYLNFLDKFHLKRTYSSMHQENLFHLVSKDISLATILPNIVSHNNYYIENGSVKSIPFSGINLFFSFYTFYSKVSTEATDLVLTLLKQYFSRLQE